MTSLVPSSVVIAEAEQLVLDLKDHSGSLADQSKTVRQCDKLRCLLHQGQDALMFQAYPVGSLTCHKLVAELIGLVVSSSSRSKCDVEFRSFRCGPT